MKRFIGTDAKIKILLISYAQGFVIRRFIILLTKNNI
jgi:hypothetical protein